MQDEVIYPFDKVKLAAPSDEVPGVGRVANGGLTVTFRAGDPGVERCLDLGWRLIDRWTVTGPRTSVRGYVDLVGDEPGFGGC